MDAARQRKGDSARSLVVLSAALALALAPAPALAQQEWSFNALLDRLDRLERDVSAVQRRLSREGVPQGVESPAGASPATFYEARLAEFEDQLRQLTDQVEKTEHQLRLLRESLPLAMADIEGRVAALEGTASPPAEGGADATPTADADAPVADGSGTLGTLPRADSGTATPEAEYEQAYALLRRADYAAAESALQAFLERHPDHELAGNAYYWLGETHYVRQDYQRAAVAFARAYKGFPDGNKAAENLLKLGMAFASMGRIEEACATFRKLRDDHPDAPEIVRDRMRRENERAGCR